MKNPKNLVYIGVIAFIILMIVGGIKRTMNSSPSPGKIVWRASDAFEARKAENMASPTTSVGKDTTIKVVEINTHEWVSVGIPRGKSYNSDVPEVNGVPDKKLLYWIKVNDLDNRLVEMPTSKEETVNFGLSVSQIYLRLAPDQYTEKAKVRFEFW